MGVNNIEIIHITSCLLDAIRAMVGNDPAVIAAVAEIT
jgi:hypothetical protein